MGCPRASWLIRFGVTVVFCLSAANGELEAQPTPPRSDFQRDVYGGRPLWDVACKWAMDLMKHHNKSMTSGEMNKMLELCKDDLARKPRNQSNSLARCMLTARDVMSVVKCGETREARRPSVYERACQHTIDLALAAMGNDGILGKAERGRLHRECILDYHRRPVQEAKRIAECVLEAEKIDEATQCRSFYSNGPQPGSIPTSKKHGEPLWHEACEHSMKRIIVETGEAAGSLSEDDRQEAMEDCNSQFRGMEKRRADQLARCILSAPTVSAMEGCPKILRKGRLNDNMAANPKLEESRIRTLQTKELVSEACSHAVQVMETELPERFELTQNARTELIDSCVVSSLTAKDRLARKNAICMLQSTSPEQLTECAKGPDPWKESVKQNGEKAKERRPDSSSEE